MGKSNYFNDCFISTSGTLDHAVTDIKRWVEAGGGVFQSAINADTTHLVASEENFKKRSGPVQTALDKDDIWIVTYEWLRQSTTTFRKKKEKPYLWPELEAKEEKKLKRKKAKTDKAAEREKKQAIKDEERRKKDAKKINYVKALTEHTDAFLNPEERAERVQSAASSSQRSSSDHRHGGRAGKNDLFSGQKRACPRKSKKAGKLTIRTANHHVYKDSTGFSFDITLVKVDMEQNKNKRVTLTIYESNSIPHTYAGHSKFAGTREVGSAEALTILGSNFPTAFRAFKQQFLKHTGIHWDDRIKHCLPVIDRSQPGMSAVEVMRANREQRKAESCRGDGKKKDKVRFEDMPFTYRLPPAGQPRGEMADGSHLYAQAGQDNVQGGIVQETVESSSDGGEEDQGEDDDDTEDETDDEDAKSYLMSGGSGENGEEEVADAQTNYIHAAGTADFEPSAVESKEGGVGIVRGPGGSIFGGPVDDEHQLQQLLQQQ